MRKNNLFSGKARLIISILALIVVIAVIAAGVYVYKADEEKKLLEQQRKDSLRMTYMNNLSVADTAYMSVQSYPVTSGRNFPSEYRAWIDGYKTLINNYSVAVNKTRSAGQAYKTAFGDQSDDYYWVELNDSRLNVRLEGLKTNLSHYESDYIDSVNARDGALHAYEKACSNSAALYEKARHNLYMENYTTSYSGLKAYVDACAYNITVYKNSIEDVETAAADYQAFLRYDSLEYDATITKQENLKKDGTSLDRRLVELQAKKPVIEVTIGATDYNYSPQLGMYEWVTFQVTNKNYPMKISNLVVSFTLIDTATGAVKDQNSVAVTMRIHVSNFEGVALRIDQGHTYEIKWTATYDY